jgi:hypothetical protein
LAPVASAPQSTAPSSPLPQGALVQLFGKLIDPNGQAAAGVGVVLSFAISNLHVATTVSDSNGVFVLTYIASALPISPDPSVPDNPVLHLSVNKNAVKLVTSSGPASLSALVKGQVSIYGPIYIVTEQPAPSGLSALAPRARLMADNETLLAAIKRAPGLFTRPVAANATNCCGPASPSDVATRVYYINQFMMFSDGQLNPLELSTMAKRFTPIRPTITDLPMVAGLRFGGMIQFRQEWWDLGFSLGDLLYSIPLAPGEETNIATVDWRRQDYAKRNTALDEANYQDTTTTRDQAIDETVNMSSDKTTSDPTIGWGVGISFGPVSGGFGETGTIRDTVNAATQAATNINDKIHQASVTTRQTRAFSIVETTQQEQATVSTRVLRNHNHCHTVTFQYFEVLRQFRISTKPIDIRPLVFVPLSPVQFGLAELLQYGYLLRRGLIDTTLQPVLDEFLGATMPANAGGVSAPTVSPNSAGYFQTFQVTAYTNPVELMLYLNGGALHLLIDDDLASPVSGSQGGGGPGDSPAVWQHTFVQAKAIPGIQKIGFRLDPITTGPVQTGAPLVLDDLSISVVNSDGTTQLVYFNPSVTINVSPRAFVDLVKNSAIPSIASTNLAPTSGGPDLTRLLSHLNGHRMYYTSLLFMAADACTRYAYLAAQGLADYIENRVIGRMGPYVAMPLVNQNLLPPQYQGQIEIPNIEQERLITLPTPGVFAESQMGSCSACETIDETKFWDWQKSPTPENAPDITAAMLTSRFQDLSSMTLPTQSNLTAPPVVIPSEPPPPITLGDQTMAALVGNLQLSNASDVTSLISSLVTASAQGYNSMIKAKDGSPGMSAPPDGGNGGLGGTGTGGTGSLIPTDTAMVPTDALMVA